MENVESIYWLEDLEEGKFKKGYFFRNVDLKHSIEKCELNECDVVGIIVSRDDEGIDANIELILRDK